MISPLNRVAISTASYAHQQTAFSSSIGNPTSDLPVPVEPMMAMIGCFRATFIVLAILAIRLEIRNMKN